MSLWIHTSFIYSSCLIAAYIFLLYIFLCGCCGGVPVLWRGWHYGTRTNTGFVSDSLFWKIVPWEGVGAGGILWYSEKHIKPGIRDQGITLVFLSWFRGPCAHSNEHLYQRGIDLVPEDKSVLPSPCSKAGSGPLGRVLRPCSGRERCPGRPFQWCWQWQGPEAASGWATVGSQSGWNAVKKGGVGGEGSGGGAGSKEGPVR